MEGIAQPLLFITKEVERLDTCHSALIPIVGWEEALRSRGRVDIWVDFPAQDCCQ